MENDKPQKQPRKELSSDEKKRVVEEEFLPHLEAMYNFAYKLTTNEEDAKDLVQESFMKALRFVRLFERGTNAKAWLFKIIKNSFINDFRKRNREPSKIDYQEVENIYDKGDMEGRVIADLRAESMRNRIGDEVSRALNSLAREYRVVIILCDLEGFTYEEMASILDIPIGTIRSRLHRARSLMKDRLADYAKKMGYKKNIPPKKE